jgi:hypothetical protein
MKQYLIGTYYVEGKPWPSEEVMQQMYAQVDAVNKEIREAGRWVFGGGLLTPENATVVNNADGKVTITDGPFAEAKEQLGGFWVLKCEDLDEALEWAKKCSAACMAPLEVRPFEDLPEG